MSEKYYVMGFINQELLGDIESKQQNNRHKDNLIFTDNVQLQVMQLLQAKFPLKLAIAPIVVWDQTSKQVEIIFISKKQEEGIWEQTLNEHVSNIISIQIGVLLDTENGPTCVERLIQKRIACKNRLGNNEQCHDNQIIENIFMDAYRLMSCGIMHHMDTREWKMTKSNRRSLVKLQCIIENKIERLQTTRMDIVRHIGNLNFAVEFINVKLYSSNSELLQDICGTSWYELEAILNEREAELKIYEDKEIDVMTEMDNLHTRLQQIKTVLQRQRDIETKSIEQHVDASSSTASSSLKKRKSNEIESH
jgi:hypothetical protein